MLRFGRCWGKVGGGEGDEMGGCNCFCLFVGGFW